MLVEVTGDPVADWAAVRRGRGRVGGRDRGERADRAVEHRAGPGHRVLTRAGGIRLARAAGRRRAGQVAGRGVPQERGGERAGVAEPGRVHRRGDDRLPVGVAAGSVVPAQQGRAARQVLGEEPVRPGGGGRGGQHRVAAHGRGRQLPGGEPGRDVDNPAAGGIGLVGEGELVEPGDQPSGHPERIAGAAPGARRRHVGVPVLRPHGRDDHVAVARQQFGQAAQRGPAAVGVGVPAQLAQPQHGPGRDPGVEPRRQRGRGRRVLERPVPEPGRDRLVGGAGLARARVAADHDQPAARPPPGPAWCAASRRAAAGYTRAGTGAVPPPGARQARLAPTVPRGGQLAP